MNATEPKSGLEIGVWFYNEDIRRLKISLPVIVQFAKKSPEHMQEPMVISLCFPCEAWKFKSQYPNHATIKRWLILPP